MPDTPGLDLKRIERIAEEYWTQDKVPEIRTASRLRAAANFRVSSPPCPDTGARPRPDRATGSLRAQYEDELRSFENGIRVKLPRPSASPSRSTSEPASQLACDDATDATSVTDAPASAEEHALPPAPSTPPRESIQDTELLPDESPAKSEVEALSSSEPEAEATPQPDSPRETSEPVSIDGMEALSISNDPKETEKEVQAAVPIENPVEEKVRAEDQTGLNQDGSAKATETDPMPDHHDESPKVTTTPDLAIEPSLDDLQKTDIQTEQALPLPPPLDFATELAPPLIIPTTKESDMPMKDSVPSNPANNANPFFITDTQTSVSSSLPPPLDVHSQLPQPLTGWNAFADIADEWSWSLQKELSDSDSA